MYRRSYSVCLWALTTKLDPDAVSIVTRFHGNPLAPGCAEAANAFPVQSRATDGREEEDKGGEMTAGMDGGGLQERG